MPEWTLCADQKVYARLRALAKPATRSVARPEDSGWPTPLFGDPRHSPRPLGAGHPDPSALPAYRTPDTGAAIGRGTVRPPGSWPAGGR
ncbi:hypothetical protein E1165_18785 [Micromonospora sp. KC723]|nr:hypothetical protein E1165_18785 [Micromonospora sp. KC723]